MPGTGPASTAPTPKGYAPTGAELATKAGVRPFAVQQRLDALEDKGHIQRDAKVARSIRLL